MDSINNQNNGNEGRTKDQKYQFCLESLKSTDTDFNTLKTVRNILQVLGDYKDSELLLEKCLLLMEEKKNELINTDNTILVSKESIQKKNHSKRIRWIILAAVFAFSVIATIVIMICIVKPTSDYKKALALYDEQRFDEAIDILNTMTNYKDARSKIYQIKTAKVNHLFENGNKEQAINLAYEIGDKELIIQLEKTLLQSATVGSSVYFGNYYIYQDAVIPWTVIAKEGNKMLLFADREVEEMRFDDNGFSNEWEKSSLRHFLNGDFYDITFSDNEKEIIQQSNILNANWRYWMDYSDKGTLDDYYKKSNTKDFVFLLSMGEIFFEYEKNISIWQIDDYDYWITRTGGEWGDVFGIKNKDESSLYCNTDSEHLIRPAIWIDMGS